MTYSKRPVSRDLADLLNMLMYKRPSGGSTEAAFIRRYVSPLGTQRDAFGNHWVTIGESDVLFSCHTDTVHKSEGMQNVLHTHDGWALVDKGECLGADCGVGVWLMAQMIREKVPGTYVFHAAEEIGGHGSSDIAEKTPERLTGIQFAIAFDRKGPREIITHQMGKRCCSDAFADSLAEALKPLVYNKSTFGSFTDTANYTKIIPECTNIGVGYDKQHTKGETLDLYHAAKLRDALIKADWSKLVSERDPSVITFGWRGTGTSTAFREADLWKWDDSPYRWGGWEPHLKEDDMLAYVRRNPLLVARFLERLGYNKKEVEDCINLGV